MARRRTKKKTAPSALRRILLGSLAVVGIALIVGGLIFASYLMQLDEEVRRRFDGVQWTLPAQVYAAPLELYPGLVIGADGLRTELDRLGYRHSDRLQGPGTYTGDGSELDIHSRAFSFWDGQQPAAQMAVSIAGGKVSGMRNLDTGESQVLFRLDPMLVGSIYPQQGEDRVLVRLDEVPPLLIQGLVAVEDQRYYEHHGISFRGIARAAIANFKAGRIVQGASTITQQLVRNFFLTLDVTWARKIREMLMAVLLDHHYSKDQILEAYLNEIFLGQDGGRAVHGVGLASQFYFNKPLSELRTHEVALVIGLVKGASYYNPRRHPQRATDRRNVVLGVFRERGLISPEEYEQAVQQPLGLAGTPQGGVARYPAFVDLVKRQLRGQYADEDLTHEGLRIFTTLDPRAQEALEANISDGLARIEKAHKMPEGTLESAGVVTNVSSGDVLAVVGGRRTRYAGFNRALDSRRSIGSLAKPFVYLTALEQPDRYALSTPLPDEPIELQLPTGQVWAPKNYDRKLHGPQPLYVALARSLNLPTVRIGLDVGEAQVLETMHDAGYSGDAKPLPSIFLGAVDAAPLEVAQMYATLGGGGWRSPLSAIREVLASDGQPLSRTSLRVQQALPEDAVYLTNWALTGVTRFGTAASTYRTISSDVVLAGKTGTTDDLRDAWFAGFGGERVGVVWVGRDDYQPMGLTGSTGALPIWISLMNDLHETSLDLLAPPDVESLLTDTASGLKADEGCPHAVLIPYVMGNEPQEWAPCAKASVSKPLQWLREIFQ